MAMLDLNNIVKLEKYRNTVHESVHATYTVFEYGDKRFFQIDTYGRSSRDMPEKISQSFQFDREAALFLKRLLEDTFGI